MVGGPYDQHPNRRASDIQVAPLTGVVDLGTIDAINATAVAIAPGPVAGSAVQLGVAWRSGCNGEAATLEFARATANTGGGSLAEVVTHITDDSSTPKSATASKTSTPTSGPARRMTPRSPTVSSFFSKKKKPSDNDGDESAASEPKKEKKGMLRRIVSVRQTDLTAPSGSKM